MVSMKNGDFSWDNSWQYDNGNSSNHNHLFAMGIRKNL